MAPPAGNVKIDLTLRRPGFGAYRDLGTCTPGGDDGIKKGAACGENQDDRRNARRDEAL